MHYIQAGLCRRGCTGEALKKGRLHWGRTVKILRTVIKIFIRLFRLILFAMALLNRKLASKFFWAQKLLHNTKLEKVIKMKLKEENKFFLLDTKKFFSKSNTCYWATYQIWQTYHAGRTRPPRACGRARDPSCACAPRACAPPRAFDPSRASEKLHQLMIYGRWSNLWSNSGGRDQKDKKKRKINDIDKCHFNGIENFYQHL